MKVRFLSKIVSRSGKHGTALDALKKIAEAAKKEFPQVDFQVLDCAIGPGNNIYFMADFDDMAALEAYLEKQNSIVRSVWTPGKDEPMAVSITREALKFN